MANDKVECSNKKVTVIEWNDVLEELLNNNTPTTIITAPNFEERSTALAHKFSIAVSAAEGRMTWQVLTLQGSNQYDVRDLIKARNCNRVHEALAGLGMGEQFKIRSRDIRIPASEADLKPLLSDVAKDMGEEFLLIIDISAMPRPLLWTLLQLFSQSEDGRAIYGKPKRIILAYAWAEAYTDTLEFETTGRLIDTISNTSVDEIVSSTRSLDAIVFTGGNVRSAFMAVEALLGNAHRNDFSIEVVHFIRSMGFSRSWEQMILHQKLLEMKPSTHRVSNSFVFNTEHALGWMRTLAQSAYHKLREDSSHRFVIVPNGPKILSVVAQMVAEEYTETVAADYDTSEAVRRSGRPVKDCVSVISAHGSQFLSVYSLGDGNEISCLELLTADHA